ncbi:MAG: methionine aminopeptidase [Planctomycetaceae bacterium]|nr:MAG: methionine aminopeptidase [Planctomycetaceae bacterium]
MTPAFGKRSRNRIPLYLTPEEQAGLRAAGRFNAQLMDYIRPYVQPGITTRELDRLVYEYTLAHGHTPATLGYKGFPSSLCTSVNEVVCHGIPNDTPLKEGDIVNIDLTTIVDGWYGDSSETFLIGAVSDEARLLVQTAFDALYAGIAAVKPQAPLTEIGKAIERLVKIRGFEVVREYQGHGIGRSFHQEPGVPHYYRPGMPAIPLVPGMCFTIEPMVNAGTWRTFLDERDGWTVRTLDLSLSAQFEHTILVTDQGPEILTQTQHGPQPGHTF